MTRRRAVVALAVLVLGVAGWWILRQRSGHRGASITRLVNIPSLAAEVFYVDANAIVRRGPPRILVVRLAGPIELVPHHFAREGWGAPRPIEEWSAHLRAPVVFTAGQFDENLNHLGWLKADGVWITRERKPQWKALLVSGPTIGGPFAGVIDLEHANPAISEEYRHVVQSMMLVDEASQVRVRESDRTACRVVVGQDSRGRMVVLVSEGAMTLADLARWLPESGLDLVRAMNMDGGIEAQIAIDTPELKLALYGQYGTGTTVPDVGVGPIRYPLPAVIAVRPAAR